MIMPNTMCRPPNPAAMSQFPQAAGPNNAAAPTNMKQIPITGTIRTENAPPVTNPVPYSSSQVPGSACASPARYSTTVRRPPTTIGGRKLRPNRRPGPDRMGSFTAYAFRTMVEPPIASATIASPSQVASHSSDVRWRAARKAAASAVAPTATCPQPGTAVNDPARSIVCRMNRRLSSARSCSGRGAAMPYDVTAAGRCQVLCNTKYLREIALTHAGLYLRRHGRDRRGRPRVPDRPHHAGVRRRVRAVPPPHDRGGERRRGRRARRGRHQGARERQPLVHAQSARRGAAPGGRARVGGPEAPIHGAGNRRGFRRGAVYRLPRSGRHPQCDSRPHLRRSHSRGAVEWEAGRGAGPQRGPGGRARRAGRPRERRLRARRRGEGPPGGRRRNGDREASREPPRGEERRARGRVPHDPRGSAAGARAHPRAVYAPGAGDSRGGLRDDDPRGHGGALPGGYAHRRSHGRVYPSGLRGSVPRVAGAAESVGSRVRETAPNPV